VSSRLYIFVCVKFRHCICEFHLVTYQSSVSLAVGVWGCVVTPPFFPPLLFCVVHMSHHRRVGLFQPPDGLSSVCEQSSDTTGQGTSGFVTRVLLTGCSTAKSGVAKQPQHGTASAMTASAAGLTASHAWTGSLFQLQSLFGSAFTVPGTGIRIPLRPVDGSVLLPVSASLTPVPGGGIRPVVLFKAGGFTIHKLSSEFEQLHPSGSAVAHLVHDMTCVLALSAAAGMLPLDFKAANMVLCVERGSRPVACGIDIDGHPKLATVPEDPLSPPTGTSWRNARTTHAFRAPTGDHIGFAQSMWSLAVTVLGLFSGGSVWRVPTGMMNAGNGAMLLQDYTAWSTTVLSLVGGTRFSGRFTGDIHDDPEAYSQIANSILYLSPSLRSVIAMEEIAVRDGADPATNLNGALWLLDFLVICLTPYSVITNTDPDASSSRRTVKIPSVFNLLQHPLFANLDPVDRFVPATGM